MKPIIGFAGDGHLMTHAFAAAKTKGFNCIKYKIGGGLGSGYCASDLKKCDIVYICPDRPSNIEPQQMVDLVLPHLRKDAVLVIHCQVEPGFTRQVNWRGIQLFYQVETLRMSDAEERALYPERIIIGNSGTCFWDSGFIEFLEAFNCPILKMSYESAELAKIAINLYLAAQVSTTNTLAEIAEKIGANWNEIIPALQTDKRIGKEAYLQPGKFGPHLQRDVDCIKKLQKN